MIMVGALWHSLIDRMQGSEIRTKRLVLRPLTAVDALRIAEIGADWDIARMTSRMPYPYSVSAANQWISGLQENEVVRGIALDGQLIGVTGYLPDPSGQSAEIGYWLGKDYWGQGFATEAAAALIAYCFRRERFSHVTCGHYTDNPMSERVIRKLGFTPTGRNRCWCEARRADVDAVRYELYRPQPAWRRVPRLIRAV